MRTPSERRIKLVIVWRDGFFSKGVRMKNMKKIRKNVRLAGVPWTQLRL